MTTRDALGDRMKGNYEDRLRFKLPRRTNTIIRLDGCHFHTYTRGRPRPWDPALHGHLVIAAGALCREAQGAFIGFVQSDEISILLTDYAQLTTEAWFDGNIQKIASVSASIVTAEFNLLEMRDQHANEPGARGRAYFDARVFTIPDPWEVHNYFVWRQKDIERNSLSMLAQANFPHKQLHGQRREALHQKLHDVGVSWDEMPEEFKHGTLLYKDSLGWDYGAAPTFTEQSPVLDLLPKD